MLEIHEFAIFHSIGKTLLLLHDNFSVCGFTFSELHYLFRIELGHALQGMGHSDCMK